ncbi:Uncharacterized protein BP5553_08077 [Venustampulla echinocandica]|uniref:LysM domain-containing protein n=1 Tax=Venustampulla echinocandica TaxID=2656787 RepID=A0A370TFN3_9HELO|nr:Uncharacterized protein BP5553_08077 [Venustampulla echinocandica]RDL33709.1 Uncharacterized protein BP5553_08077 [Venustampulla echinocandica]
MIPSSTSFRSRTPDPRSDSTGPSASIRPRNRRLNTVDQELGSTSGTSTPAIGSRAVSPIPAKHPSRTGGSGSLGNGRPIRGSLAPSSMSRNAGQNKSGSSSPIGGMWNTGWMSSTLQQVASSVLGSMSGDDEASRNEYGSDIAKGKTRRTADSRARSKRTLPDEWGPSISPANARSDGGIGMGSTSKREAAVKAMKMKDVLEGGNNEESAIDVTGHYKRRTSSDIQRPASAQDEGDALAYIHHVQPHDTFAGVVLKYNCQKDIFRKANGLWSNDSIQFRKTVVLPVDACAVKGRPCELPSADSPYQGVDLLAPTPADEEPPPIPRPEAWPSITQSPYGASAEPPAEEEEKPWTHVRWVLIDSSPSAKPVEIARMSRKTLGYFPPRRRKSLVASSSVSSPRGSTDLTSLSRSLSQLSSDPSGSPASTRSRRTSNLGPQPSLGSYFPTMTSASRSRSRRRSVSESADRYGWMRGPGGVGTMGKNVRKPGPGQDGLNAWTRKHIPGLTLDSLPSTSIMGAESAHFGFGEELSAIAEGPYSGGSSVNGAATPGGSQGLGLENAAAAVEGFFRKLVIKGPGTPRVGGRESDLIELLDGTGSDDGRGFELSPGRSRNGTPVGTGREDLDGVIRGRSTAGAKGGKSD